MKKSSIGILFAVTWIMAMVCLYYWGHKPFDLDQFASLSRAVLDLVLVALVILLAGGIGRRLFALWKESRSGSTQKETCLGSPEIVVLQAAAGLGVLSLLWLLLGVLGLYYPITAWIVLLTGCALFQKDCRGWLKSLSSFSVFWKNGRKFDRVLIFFLLFMIGMQVIWALAPPIKYDALTYHLQLPRQYIAQHRFAFLPENPYWGHPQLGEMLFTWMMLLDRAETAALMGAGWGILALLGVMGTVSRLSSIRFGDNQAQFSEADQVKTGREGAALRAALVAALALVCGATFRSLLGWAYIDLLSALMGWAALAALLFAFDEEAGKWGIWAGFFCSLAIGTKWTAGIAAPVVFSVLLFNRKRIGMTWKQLVVAVCLTILVVCPWLVKNTIATGSPVYPYFIATSLISEQRLQSANVPDRSVTRAEGLLFPVTSTLFGFDSAAGFGTDLGPLLALLAIPGLWYMRHKPAGWIILCGLIAGWVVIAVCSPYFNFLQQTRLYFVLLPWAGFAAGMGWVYLADMKTKVMRVENLLAALLILVVIFVSIQEINRIAGISPLQAVLVSNTREDYVSRSTGWYFPAVDSLNDLPEGSKVLMLWEARGFYAPLNTTSDMWIDRWRNDYWTYGSAENILGAWRSQGYTHVLLYRNGAEMIREGDTLLETAGWAELDRLADLLPDPQTFGDVYELYTLVE